MVNKEIEIVSKKWIKTVHKMIDYGEFSKIAAF